MARAVVLDGSRGGEMAAAREAVTSSLGKKGYVVTVVDLSDKDIADCTGCFGCWTKTPGRCVVHDEGEHIAALFSTSEVVVLLSPVVFGGYSYDLKKALDRSICVFLPFFKRVGGEVHHPRRYELDQRLVAVGLLPQRDEGAQRVFSELVRRNSLNLQPVGWAAALVFADERRELSAIAVEEALIKAGVGP